MKSWLLPQNSFATANIANFFQLKVVLLKKKRDILKKMLFYYSQIQIIANFWGKVRARLPILA